MELQQSKIMSDIQAVEAKLSETISNVVTQSIVAQSEDAAPAALSVNLKKDLGAITDRLDKLQDKAAKEKTRSEESASKSEEAIQKTQDKIADHQKNKKELEDKRNQLTADQAAAQTEYSHLQQDTARLQNEINSLSEQIKAAQERERVRKILLCIPIINIGAAIESACSDDREKIRQKGWELQEKAKQLSQMEARINQLAADIQDLSSQTEQLGNKISDLQSQLVRMVQESLASKKDMVMWSRVLEYFGMLSDRLTRLIHNSVCEDDLMEWLNAQQDAGRSAAAGGSGVGSSESELGRLRALYDQARTPMNRTSFYSGGALHSDQFDDLTDDTDSCYAFPDGIQIRCGDIIDGIRFRYDTADTPIHGGEGGSPQEYQLDSDEFIVKAEGRYGPYWNNNFVYSLRFTTNKGRRLEAGSKNGGSSSFVAEAPEGHAICGIYGETAHPVEGGRPLENCRMLSGIGFYTRPIPPDGRR